MADVWTLLQQRRRRAPGDPVVTFVAADGARVELSATTLENAAAKIANALHDEFDLDQSGRVGLRLPVHWQRSAWLAGVWTAGCIASLSDGLVTDDVDLLVTTVDAVPASDTSGPPVAVVSLHPFGLPVAEPLPPGVVDATALVRSQPDAFLGAPPTSSASALAGDDGVLSQEQVLALATERAAAWGLPTGRRLLVTPRIDPLDAWLAALAVPLVADASVILVAGDHDLDQLAEQEKIATRLG